MASNLETQPPEELNTDAVEEPATETVPQSDDLKHMDDEEDLQYPNSSPGPTRPHLPKIVEGAEEEDVAMEVDEPMKADAMRRKCTCFGIY